MAGQWWNSLSYCGRRFTYNIKYFLLCRGAVGPIVIPVVIPMPADDGFCSMHNLNFWSHSALFWICQELFQNEIFCITQNENFSFLSAVLQKDTLHIGLNCYKHNKTDWTEMDRKGTEIRDYVVGTSESGCQRVGEVVLEDTGFRTWL